MVAPQNEKSTIRCKSKFTFRKSSKRGHHPLDLITGMQEDHDHAGSQIPPSKSNEHHSFVGGASHVLP
jgi:hypothetical protein